MGKRQAAQTLFINDISVIIFLPIAFNFGFKRQRLYYAVACVPDFEYSIVGSSLSMFLKQSNKINMN